MKSMETLKAPFRFGLHPDFERKIKRARARIHQSKLSGEELLEAITGRRVSLSTFVDPRHLEVYLIPRDKFIDVVDEWDDPIGIQRISLPFGSFDFYIDLFDRKNSVFHELYRSAAFFRLGGISQLGYLIPPRIKKEKEIEISYLIPQFPQTRWLHSLLVAILTEVILAQNGFSKEERLPVLLTAGCHDIATPAGGDSTMRVIPEMDEEKNFSWVMKHYGLDKRWAKQFGFDLTLAKNWVEGKGVIGKLLKIVDKICYAAIDCYYLGLAHPGRVRTFCLRHPLIMDIWQDIRFNSRRTNFGFLNPERLFHFLLLRAYEYQELLFNPYSRTFDLFLGKLVRPLYEKGIITKEQLLTHGDNWLVQILERLYPKEIKPYIEPKNLCWKKFETDEEREEFCAKLGDRVDHNDEITTAKFATGLDWSVFRQGRLMPLKEAISKRKIKILKKVWTRLQGHYVYYRS